MKEHIAACIVRENEAKPLVLREELDGAVVHRAGHLATEALTGLRCANAGALGGSFLLHKEVSHEQLDVLAGAARGTYKRDLHIQTFLKRF